MNELTNIDVKLRTEFGKGYARRLRRDGLVPAILYAKGVDTVHVSFDPVLLIKAMNNPKKRNTVITFKFEDGGEKFVMLKDYQTDPVNDAIKHVDFIEIHYGMPLKLDIPLVFIGEPIGVVSGGVLNQTRRELEVECLPKNIPNSIEVDVSELDIGDTLHIEDIKTHEEFTLIYDNNFTVGVVNAPTVLVEEEEEEKPEEGLEGEEGAEGEEGKEGGEGGKAGEGEKGEKSK